jgi:hypothetical protein
MTEKFTAFEHRNVLQGSHAEKRTPRYCHTATTVISTTLFVGTLFLFPLDHRQPDIDGALDRSIIQKVGDDLLIGRVIVLLRKT